MPPTIIRRTGRRPIGPAVIAAALCLVVGACGAEADEAIPTDNTESPDTQSSDTRSSTTSAPSDGGDQSIDLEAAEISAADFSHCMAERGIELPEVALDDEGDVALGDIVRGVDAEDPTTRSALLACQGQLDAALGGQLTELLESDTVENALTEFSQCVRDGGYDVADLTFPALVSGALGADPGPDPRGQPAGPASFLAVVLDLDPQDVDVLDTIDGCAELVEGSLADLGLG